jgi:hypothetical protein
VLAIGFLLVILSCALFGNWLPILVGEYIHFFRQRDARRRTGSGASPRGPSVTDKEPTDGRCSCSPHLCPRPHPQLSMRPSGRSRRSFSRLLEVRVRRRFWAPRSCLMLLSSAPVDLGHFLTAVTIVSGLALPLVLSHAEVIHPAACWMSIAGGALVYGTITIYAHFFSRDTEPF